MPSSTSRSTDWLHETAGEELVEIRAYHLDQAATLHEELDGVIPPELAARAAAALEKAGRRTLAREANRSARRLLVRAVELEPTLQRRFLAARAARRIADLPAQAVEMERVFADATEAGDKRLQGLALTALADNALLREADLPRGRELVEQALVLLEDGKPEDRYEALSTRARIGWWLGDLDDDERWIGKALEVAKEIGRKDLEANAADELASSAIARLDLDRAGRLVAEALELAEESGNITALGWALVSQARIDALRGLLDEATAGLGQAEDLFSQSGNAWALARVSNHHGWVERRRGDLVAADRRFRDAIRILKPLEDRGTLCESQRGLAQVLVARGKIDEAERYALESRETVGPHDTISRSTTRMALGMVRAAQGRDEEAEALLRESVDIVAGKELYLIRREVLLALAGFLRERDRADEAEEYEAEIATYSLARRARVEHCANRLRRLFVGRLRDHGRRALEPRERIAQRLRPKRSVAVREVLRLVSVCVGDVGEVDVERRSRLEDGVHALERRGERVDVGESSVGGRVHVCEVDHRPHPREPFRDMDDVVERAELVDASHHLEPEHDRAALLLEPLAQHDQPGNHVVEGLLAIAAKPEAGMDDDELCSCGRRDPGAPVQRAERLLRLLLVGMAGEGEERRVHRERDLVLTGDLREPLGPRVVHPEPALEVELTGGIAALEQDLHGGFRRLPGRATRWSEADRSHALTVTDDVRPTGVLPFSRWHNRHLLVSICSNSTSTSGSPTSGARPATSPSGTSRSSRRSCAPRTGRATATRSPRTIPGHSVTITGTGFRRDAKQPPAPSSRVSSYVTLY